MKNEFLGWPIVTAENCFDVIRGLGIKPWPETRPMEALREYEARADEAQRKEIERFAPKTDVQFLQSPTDGSEQRFFRVKFRPWCTVVALIPGPHDPADHPSEPLYVPITAEYKQGNRLITLVPPSGVVGKAEVNLADPRERMRATAHREFQEEVGIKLDSIIPLGPQNGYWDQVRSSETQFFPFWGTLKAIPTERSPSKLDQHEFLKLVLFEVREWLKLVTSDRIPDGFGIESCALCTTMLALQRAVPVFNLGESW